MTECSHLQEADVILTDSLELQRGPPVCQQAKLLLQTGHKPLPLWHHCVQLVLDPAHHLRPDPVQRAGHLVQELLHLTSLSVCVGLKRNRKWRFKISVVVLNNVQDGERKMSDFDAVQFPLQLSHVNLSLLDPVQDLLLRPRYLFLSTQVSRVAVIGWAGCHMRTTHHHSNNNTSSSTCLLSRSVWTETVLCVRCSSRTQMAQMQRWHVRQYTWTSEHIRRSSGEKLK